MIRSFSSGDTSRVMEIWLEASRLAHSFIPMEYWLNTAPAVEREILPRAQTRVFVKEGQVLGFLSLIERSHIGALFVDPACQGQGIGRTLMEDCKRGRDLLTLSVYQKNTGAIAFYRSQGFVPLGEDTDPATGEGELLMCWRASPSRK
jgi:putative acetyltransferase